jgi:hypothetical protein
MSAAAQKRAGLVGLIGGDAGLTLFAQKVQDVRDVT